jgi:DNA-binding response OmpR family regulator
MLVVEDDVRYAEWLRHHLDVLCPRASVSVLNLAEFERWCSNFSGRDCDLLLLGCRFGTSPEDPSSSGLGLLRRLRDQPAAPAVIAIAEDGNELTAVRALQLGALDYLPKKLLTPERLSTAVRVALRRVERRVQRRLASLANMEQERAAQAVHPAAGAEAAVGSAADAQGADAEAPRATETAAAAAPALPAPGVVALLTAPAGEEFIPGYTLRLKVGESEKAAVYLASSAARGHNVALKVSKTLRDEVAGRQFLEREYTAVQAIKNPLVVEIYDYGVHAGYEYLAMEYLPRGDLKARILRGVTERESLQFLQRIAEALQVVHEAGLVHRDLKPPNVMLRDNDAVALIDFGLARQIDGGTTSLQTGQTAVLRGSPYYMSPEQALGEQLDGRSDFYSLGIILYEMLTGNKPYTGATALDVLQQHVNSPVPQLPQLLERYQPLLTRLVAKARTERFAAATEIASAAGELLAAVPAEPQSTAA